MTEARNVLFITADQWRGDYLAAMGHPVLKTPNLDRLAADGLLFRRHSAQTTPCGPSRASLLTGLYLMNHRAVTNGTPLDRRHSNVALEARKLGYDPVVFGYTDIGADPRRHHPGDPVLTTYESVLPGMTPMVYLGGDQRAWRADLLAKGYDLGPKGAHFFARDETVPGAAERGPTFAPARYRAEDSDSAFLTGEAIKYLSVRDGMPWFVHISYLAPHPPFIAPQPYHALYDPEAMAAPLRASSREAEGALHPYLAALMAHPRGSGYDEGTRGQVFNDFGAADIAQARATYCGMIAQIDDQVGRLIDALKAMDLYDSTLIVFTSDHGEQLGDHWQFNKYGFQAQTIHIPLILRDPDATADAARGGEISAFSESVDVMPTILEWLGGEVPLACDGSSLLPFGRGETPADWREEGHWEHDFRDWRDSAGRHPLGLQPDLCAMAAIFDERYKYVHFTGLPPLFFDLADDPGEFVNRAEDPAYREPVLAYAQKMLSWRMNHADRSLAAIRLGAEGAVEIRTPRR